MAAFAQINVSDWRQFSSVNMDLTHRVTVLTGTNGTGKTTLINILSMHFGWSLSFVSTPKVRKRRLETLWSDTFDDRVYSADDIPNDRLQIGTIDYEDGTSCGLFTQRFVSANYNLEYSNMQSTVGLYIPSHRPIAAFTPVQQIPTNPVAAQAHYQQYQQLVQQMFAGGNTQNPGRIQKQALISLAVFGEGNSSVLPNEEYIHQFEEFQRVLRITLPPEIGFEKISIRNGDVVLITRTGSFSIDSMSGGVNAIFAMTWQICMYAASDKAFTVIIDEPENHLHPSMQKTFLPNLAAAFPNTKFIIATHSPFVITSFPEAAVYGLSYNDDRKVISQKLDAVDLSGTPNKILRDVLGVGSNLPLWVEKRVREVIEETETSTPEERGRALIRELGRMNVSDSLTEIMLRDN